MNKKLITFLATGTYTGYLPKMPGTFGTLWGVPLAYLSSRMPLLGQAAFTLAVCLASVYIAGRECESTREKDPSRIVIDEAAGYLVSFFLMPFTLFNVILVFILFRFFDILKPYPIGVIDRGAGGGTGVVLDDIGAGVYAGVSAHIISLALR
ncbi:MAG: phosphatidylglycerophosphatase A [Deltaproteobacteria bacterium]|nr:phosphatidylglycerophosphatase A [Deltaproteobacteria bacterium]